jgi:hypothetical protein
MGGGKLDNRYAAFEESRTGSIAPGKLAFSGERC